MQLVEVHQIKRSNKLFKELDQLAFLSKNIYNSGMYLIKQEYFNNKKHLNYFDINRIMVDQKNVDYYKLPCKVSNNILQGMFKGVVSFYRSLKEFNVAPSKFLGRPHLPRYKHSLLGRNIIPYEKGAISKAQFKKHKLINFSGTDIKIKTKITSWDDIQAARIVPCLGYYKIEIIYNKQPIEHNLNKENTLGIDIGLNNLVAGATTTNKSFLINGRPLKSINNYYNKHKGEIQSKLESINKKTSKRLNKLTNKRNNKVNDYLHKSSSKIINYCLTNNIGNIIVGHNDGWKQEINLGKRNNQNFVQIPFNNLII